MGNSIKFCVRCEDEGVLPPKKYVKGRKSMWGIKSEVEKLIALRRNAWCAIESPTPLGKNIHLTLRVYVTARQARLDSGEYAGDLDNFIAGVCDGLGKGYRSRKSEIRELWEKAEHAIQPARRVAITDDSRIHQIHAIRVECEEPWYEVELKDTTPVEL